MYRTNLKDKIIEATNSYQQYLRKKHYKKVIFNRNLILMYKDKVYASNSSEMKNVVVKEFHSVPYVLNPRYKNKVATVRSQYFCLGMKKEVVNSRMIQEDIQVNILLDPRPTK
jgi:hypothetical protein